jgi:hypothetical protein
MSEMHRCDNLCYNTRGLNLGFEAIPNNAYSFGIGLIDPNARLVATRYGNGLCSCGFFGEKETHKS